ncbi:MAG: dihydrolipoyl dehydrogenase [Desulfocapsaceae bacterium]|nr:dihydrolipoyl dehydrogenase [Desulfocapsaceae bacterium]
MVMGELEQETGLLVIGSGPGGYAAAFRAADLGLDVTMVDPQPQPGGVCLFSGCIPSKTLLFLSELIHDAARSEHMGVAFGPPRIDLAALRGWKAEVIGSMAGGLTSLCRQRGIQLLQGRARFEGSHTVRLQDSELRRVTFKHAVIATGSETIPYPGRPFVPGGRIMDSAGALALADIPETLLIIGGGYVGLELGTAFAALGSRVTVVEMAQTLLPGVDRDLVAPLQRRLQAFVHIHLQTRVAALQERDDGVDVLFEGPGIQAEQRFDRVLVAIGRRPASTELDLARTGVTTDERGFILVDEQLRTADPAIFAVGDVAGGMMLANKASREGKVAAEAIAGKSSAYDVRSIPAIIYTDPQIAWCGLTEDQARAAGIDVKVLRFPWKFSGRAHTMGAPEGLTKLIADPETGRIVGVGAVGRGAEGLISEGSLAVEMGVLAEDMALSLHPHPTLSETEGEAAELYLGSSTHILARKA